MQLEFNELEIIISKMWHCDKVLVNEDLLIKCRRIKVYKAKIIVYGLGQAWENQKSVIERLFDVIGYCDKRMRNGAIPIEEIDSYNADYVYITSNKYCSEIEKELAFLKTKIISKRDILGNIQTGGGFRNLNCNIDEIELRKNLVPLMGKRDYFELFFKLYMWALEGMNIGVGSEIETSGELNVLDFIINKIDSTKKSVLFDVGANVGDYTKQLLNCFNNENVEIHSFEPSAYTFQTLTENIQNRNVILNNVGLSDKKKEAILYYDKENSEGASLFDRQLDYFGIQLSKQETVKLITLDEYCAENHIETIDFLKMDVEGNELNVLKGATKMFAQRGIRAIQFEFGGANLDSRTYFRDFWNLLNDSYHIYRILKDGLMEINQYNEYLDIFTCTNYFAMLKDA